MKILSAALVLGLVLGTGGAAGQETPTPTDAPAARLDELVSLAEVHLGEARRRGEKRREEIDATESGARRSFEESSQKAAELADRPSPLTADADLHEADARALYGELRRQVDFLRAEVADARRRRIEAEAQAADVRAEVADARRELASAEAFSLLSRETLEKWEGALEGRVRVSAGLVAMEESHGDRMFVLLKETKTLRRRFEKLVPAAARRADRKYLPADLTSEARLVLPFLKAVVRHRLRTLAELPGRWSDWDFVTGLVSGLVRLLLVLLLWWIARRAVRRGAPHLVRLWAARSQHFVPPDLWGMAEPAQRTLASSTDLVAVGVLLGPVRAALPELGLLLLVVLQVALYRLILGFASLALATHPAVRPALVTLEPRVRRLALATVRCAVLWLIARQFLRYTALEILGAVSLEEFLRLLFDLALAVVGFLAFHVWEPFLEEALLRRDPLHRLVALLTRSRLGPLRAFQGMAQTLLYLYLRARDFFSRFGEWSSILDPFKKPKPDTEDEKPPELPGEVVAKLLRRDRPREGRLERKGTREVLDDRWRRWQSARRRGTALVAGDEGMGKHTLVDSWCEAVEGEGDGATILRLRLSERLITAEDARRWLAERFGIENPPADPGGLADRIEAGLPASAVVLEDLQFAFLRRVDGFAGLNFVLSVVGSSCDRFFWVFTLHRPAWRYLSSLGGLVHTEVFRTVIELSPFAEGELRRIVAERTAASGYEADFTHLLPPGARFRPNPLALERVTTEYFRRLAWASQGNPTVALRLWRETLAIEPPSGGVDEGHLVVERYPISTGLSELRDTDLFLLAAIHTHRSLTEPELVEVTNMSPARVSAAVKNLEGRRLLATRSKRFSIEPRHLPAVTADLRRRHFIHGSM